jgi:hypothetical protein
MITCSRLQLAWSSVYREHAFTYHLRSLAYPASLLVEYSATIFDYSAFGLGMSDQIKRVRSITVHALKLELSTKDCTHIHSTAVRVYSSKGFSADCSRVTFRLKWARVYLMRLDQVWKVTEHYAFHFLTSSRENE